jgi:hypothetical protein
MTVVRWFLECVSFDVLLTPPVIVGFRPGWSQKRASEKASATSKESQEVGTELFGFHSGLKYVVARGTVNSAVGPAGFRDRTSLA